MIIVLWIIKIIIKKIIRMIIIIIIIIINIIALWWQNKCFISKIFINDVNRFCLNCFCNIQADEILKKYEIILYRSWSHWYDNTK